MNLNEIIVPELTRCNIDDVASKKQVLEAISRLVSEVDDRVKYPDILESLQQRERLGSTALGFGVAIPHGRIKELTKPLCVLFTLKNAVDFANGETIAVDIVFGLLVPENAKEEHINILSTLAEQLQNKTFRDNLRNANSHDELYHTAMTVEDHDTV